ncbi:MAG: response regulator, partial [Calditrichaeota bacterium]
NDPHDPQSLSSDVIYCILPDPRRPNRFLWLGTKGGGLNRFDMQKKTFQQFTEKDGLANNVVYGVLPDDRGNLWMSTNHGLCRITLSADSLAMAEDSTGLGIVAIKNFDVSDGLQSNEFNYHAFCRGPSGWLYFGGINGITSFDPREIRENRYRPPVVITNFLLAYKPVDHRQPISETDEITLSYKQNALSLEFAALDFTAPQKNQYAYQMVGVDEDWLYSGNEHRANYLNLSPGHYIFRVKGSNNDGVWNEKGASLKITILPPWWETWWAYAIYVLVLGVVLYGVRRYELSRIRLKDQLKMKRFEAEKLKELDQMKSRFIANLSHEFRTPLTLILGQLEALEEEIDHPGHTKKLNLAVRHARKLQELINQLLDVARLEAGKMPFKAQLANIVPFLKKLFASFESLAARKKLGVRFYAERDRIDVYYEPEKLEKIFVNLVSNAIKFTPEGGEVSVGVRLPRIDGRAEWAEIEVRDSGIGIPEEHLPYIFDRFYQVESGNTRDYEGTGIGLALVKELVALHSGEIQVTSKVGMGTVFRVRLPLGGQHSAEAPSAGAEEAAAEPAVASASKTTLPTGGGRDASRQPIVLIVEDNPDMRQYICENLKETCTTAEARDGARGFEMAKELIPDLIISDVMMPNIDGYELVRRIRSHEMTSHIPIIMLTAKAAEEDRLEGLETGADAYLIKPFSRRELQIRVRKLIEMRRKLLEQRKQPLKITASEVAVTPVDEQFLERLQQVVEENMEDEHFQVGDLCRSFGIGERQLYRKLQALLGCTPAAYIRQIRLQRAKQLLEKGAGTVSEITFMVGYGNTSAFARAFREAFGKAPSEVLKK